MFNDITPVTVNVSLDEADLRALLRGSIVTKGVPDTKGGAIHTINVALKDIGFDRIRAVIEQLEV